MKRGRARRVLIALVVLAASTHVSAASNFTNVNPPGPFAVGLRFVYQYDYARSYAGKVDSVTGKPIQRERARPIQTSIWYPASQRSATATTLKDYFALRASEEDFTPTAEAVAVIVQSQTRFLTPQRAAEELAQPMLATVDAAAAPGPFPLIIYAPSFGSSGAENADLCEYLASHGFVVISSPGLGARPGGMTQDVEGIEAQAADIEFLIGFARSIREADTNRIAVVGYSWGGIANIFAAAKDPRITALVALDGSIRYFPDLAQEARYVKPSRITAPFLYLAAPYEVEDFRIPLGRSNSFLTAMKFADVYNVTLHPMLHGDFAASGQRLTGPDIPREYDNHERAVAYAWMETYVLNFLNADLKDDAGGAAFMSRTPAENHVPPHLLSSSVHRSEGIAPTRETFAAQLSKTGFDHAEEVYASFKALDADFAIPEVALNEWGYRLMSFGDSKAAVAILKLGATLHSTSSNAFNSLGEAYLLNGNKALAIEAYRHSVKLDPRNTDSIHSLKEIGVDVSKDAH